jgi:short-subunit dehydrogenase
VQRVVVVGARGGIAAALCHEYARRGSPLTLVGRDRARLESLADELSRTGASPRPRTIECDLLDTERIGAATLEALAEG